MLSDPQSITVNAVAKQMYKTSQGPTTNVFTSADGLFTLTTKQNQTAKRFRREVRITHNKVAADPLTAVNSQEGASVYIVVDEPKSGVFSDSELGQDVAALAAYVGTGNFTQILRGEF